MSLSKKIPVSFVVTIVLTLVLAFIAFNSLAPSLNAVVCAIGGCNCGECEDCQMIAGKIPFANVVYYGCSCPGVVCQGTAQ